MDAAVATPLSQQVLQQITEEFFREGCVIVPRVLTANEVATLRTKTDEYSANPNTPSKHISYVGSALVLRHCHELDPLFADMVRHVSIVRIAEAVLGSEAAFNAMNIIRNQPGQAIYNWHVDDVVEFPLPPEVPRFDPRMRMPVFWMTVQVALSDIDRLEHGPTQFVPGSHYSGRRPNSEENPVFEARGPKSVFCKAGDIYLTDHQCWHRGAPNLSDRTRYIMQLQYAKRWADRRFKGTA